MNHHFYDKLDDRDFLIRSYKAHLDKELNIDNPSTLNEKIQWLKLNDRNPLYTEMVDKYTAKKYVSKLIGEQHIIPTIGVWNSFDEIDFDDLPDQFVLKCTHDSGGLVICRNKSNFDKVAAKKQISSCLKRNYFLIHREWPYKNIEPRIIAEPYMTDNGVELADYKIHNFNGTPKLILVCRNRFCESGLTEDFFSRDWEHLNIKRPNHPNAQFSIECPAELEEMLKLSEIISKDIPFVRTDFYVINHMVYFGEITFYPASGFVPFVPEEWDKILGDWLTLPEKQ